MEHRIKLGTFVSPHPSEDELCFVEQLGLKYVYTWLHDPGLRVSGLSELIERLLAHGLTLYNAGCVRLGKSPNIHLGLEDRDRDIDEFSGLIRVLGEVGVGVTTFTWEPDQVWSTDREATRGGADARAVDASILEREGPKWGRRYEREELWDNFAYFMERIIPVAEESGVRLALHPNDPPLEEIAGVPCLIRSGADYRRAFDVAGSDALGMEFCVGCWLEGGEGFGNLLEGIGEFGRAGRILVVHFRNVSAPLPRFVETFVDDGYGDMPAVMRALAQADYDGTAILDHSPRMAPCAGDSAGTAFAVGYMKALLDS